MQMGSDTPAAPVPVVAPQVDQSLIDQQTADYARRRRGRAATQLAGDQSSALGSLPSSSLAVKQLLGS